MKIASLILPRKDNAGESLFFFHGCLRAELLEAFGGFSEEDIAPGMVTSANIRGAWKDPDSGNVFHDESIRYDIAADWDSLLSRKRTATLLDRLHRIAARYSRLCEQFCVMVIDPDGSVSLVKPETAPAQATRESWQDRKAS